MVSKGYRVLINDGMEFEGAEIFEKHGIEYVNEHLKGDRLLNTVGEFDALLVRSKTKVTKEVIEAGARGILRMIGRGGVGTDNIDKATAKKYGIVVKAAPNGVTNSTAEHAISLMFSVARKIPQAHYALKNGVWRKKEFEGMELEGKTLGVFGCGRIGQRVAEKGRALGMEVIGHDVNMDYARRKFPDSMIRYTSKEDVLAKSDIISLHTGGKELVIGREEFAIMKPGAILINASRGENVDEVALYEALADGRVRGAGLDTYVGEPKDEGQQITESMKRFAGLENVVLSPHLGASTIEGQRKTSFELARITTDYLLNANYGGSVNTRKPSQEGKPCYIVWAFHRDTPGMFGKITQVLGNYGINIRAVESEEVDGDGDVVTNVIVHQRLDQDTLDELKGIDGVKRVLFTDPKRQN